MIRPALTLLALACSVGMFATTITIHNPSSKHYADEAVPTVRWTSANPFRVLDSKGNMVAYQVTSDSLLVILLSDLPSKATATYTIEATDQWPEPFAAVTQGRVWPERSDDLAWENDFISARAYGPALQASGEKGYGYDLFVKPDSVRRPVLEEVYAPQLAHGWWRRYEEFRSQGDAARADSMLAAHSYHIDRGFGMDCFAVGPTLGGGCTALVTDDDEILYPWAWAECEILDNGPLRFRARLRYTPVVIDGELVTEVRDIILDAGSRLNFTSIAYEGLTRPMTIVAGFPLRDDGATVTNTSWLAYINPTLNLFPSVVDDQGKVFQGIATAARPDSINVRTDGQARHLVATSTYRPGDAYDYWWGFAWDRANVTWSQWLDYMSAFSDAISTPLVITVN